VVLIPKLVVAAALGLGVAYFFNDNFLGLSSVSIIGGITFCNMALYTGIMGEFGDESEQGAVGILFFTAGPAVTMIILGVSGLANIPVGTIIGSILPLVIGMVWATSSRSSRTCWFPVPIRDCCHRFQLGASMSLRLYHRRHLAFCWALSRSLSSGPSLAFERLCGGNGKAAVACSTIAGTAMTTPVALAEVAPRYADLAPTAYAQIATPLSSRRSWPDSDRLGRQEVLPGKEDLSVRVLRLSRRPSQPISTASNDHYDN
ncbi:MAG: 2-keto-3-deoxygluconate permease, partial [Collinsella sp.]